MDWNTWEPHVTSLSPYLLVGEEDTVMLHSMWRTLLTEMRERLVDKCIYQIAWQWCRHIRIPCFRACTNFHSSHEGNFFFILLNDKVHSMFAKGRLIFPLENLLLVSLELSRNLVWSDVHVGENILCAYLMVKGVGD